MNKSLDSNSRLRGQTWKLERSLGTRGTDGYTRLYRAVNRPGPAVYPRPTAYKYGAKRRGEQVTIFSAPVCHPSG